MSHLWDHFNQLYDPDTGGMGPARLSYQEIDAYCRTTGTSFTHREVRLLRRLSDTYLKIVKERMPKTPQAPTKDGKVFRPVNGVQGIKDLFSRLGGKAKSSQ